MRVLVTGASGNIGKNTVRALVEAGHQVRCFDLETKSNRKAARNLPPGCSVVWGDLRKPEDVARAVEGQDAVVHLAFVIPKISATGIDSETHPDWAREINVGGTRNLIRAMTDQPRRPRLVFASSLHVFGQTQDLTPPRKVWDRVRPVEHYAQHKVTCEGMVRAYPGQWAIMRFAAAMPVRLIIDPGMFDVALGNRMEYVHARDVATALTHSLDSAEVWGRTWLIGGGPRCQYYYRDIVRGILEGTGLGMLPEEAFTTEPFATDWLDTSESQRVLQFQSRTLDDYVAEVRQAMGWRLYALPLVSPFVRAWLLRRSPYYRKGKRRSAAVPRRSET